MITHWYHVFVGPGSRWREPVEEHLQALARARFDGRFKVGIVGPEDCRREALDVISAQRTPDRVAQFDDGWEQCTLRQVRAEARRHPTDLTIYCHTKGASRNEPRIQAAWRRSMTCALFANLPANVAALQTHDAVGCHWLDPLPDTGPGFGGNFWMATNRFLSSLPPVGNENRYQAEGWLGSGSRLPRVLDLNPGFPGTVSWVHGIGWPR